MAWAVAQFGGTALGDERRTARAVAIGAGLRAHPDAVLPEQLAAPGALKAAYRLLDEEDVSHQALMAPHWEQTRAAARREGTVLLVQDTTTLDYSHHPRTRGLGPVGDGRGRGFLVHSVLAVTPGERRVLGLAHQRPFLRQPAPAGETRTARHHRPKESDCWAQAAAAIGPAPSTSRWVHVGDADSDIFTFLAACRGLGCHFLVRACQNRRLDEASDPQTAHLLDRARALPALGSRELLVRERGGRPARLADLQVAAGPVLLSVPLPKGGRAPLPCWVVRVWEPAPPEDTDPLEWVLLTSLPTATVADAWERADWYTCRWVVEDYHMGLKTGCRLEQRHLHTADRLWRLLGFLAPVAVCLLQLRQAARQDPDRPAAAVVPPLVLAVVAQLTAPRPAPTTLQQFWHATARLGGYQGRRGDGPPGWQTLWKGWQTVQTVLHGVHLAHSLALPTCG